jgi:hypothetical protein
MPPEIDRLPSELEAPDNPEAEGLQRERERIRNEEVLPLEQRLKQLEAIHSELETFIAQLQVSLRNVGSSSGKSEPPEGNTGQHRPEPVESANDRSFPSPSHVPCSSAVTARSVTNSRNPRDLNYSLSFGNSTLDQKFRE